MRPCAPPATGGLPPAIILGGGTNALSVARGIGRAGARVYALNRPKSHVFSSRYVDEVRTDLPWAEWLLGSESDSLAGAVVLACSDDGLEILIEHREALLAKFRLDISNVEAQRRMLNKLDTVEEARKAGVPTPRVWVVEDAAGVVRHRGEYVYPVIVKPRHTHLFAARTGRKFLVVDDYEALRKAFEEIGMPCILQEKVPMPDDHLCSYYTYLDEDGRPLFHYTKRIIRRFPKNEGAACYHVNDWNPEVKELGLRFFQSVGLRGLCNVEFVRDDRDGQLKLIECNARFTAGDPMLAATGFDLGRFVYNRIAGRPQLPLVDYDKGRYFWYPVEDLKACLELRRLGEITFWKWIKSLSLRPILPYWSWTDPGPTVVAEFRRWRGYLGKVFGRR